MSRTSQVVAGAVHVAGAAALIGTYAAGVATAPFVAGGSHVPTNNRECRTSWCTPGSPDSPDATGKRWQQESIAKVAKGHDCVSPEQFGKIHPNQFPKSLIVTNMQSKAMAKTGEMPDTISARRTSFDEGFSGAKRGEAWIWKACAK